jgi:hypothetical protein
MKNQRRKINTGLTLEEHKLFGYELQVFRDLMQTFSHSRTYRMSSRNIKTADQILSLLRLLKSDMDAAVYREHSREEKTDDDVLHNKSLLNIYYRMDENGQQEKERRNGFLKRLFSGGVKKDIKVEEMD